MKREKVRDKIKCIAPNVYIYTHMQNIRNTQHKLKSIDMVAKMISPKFGGVDGVITGPHCPEEKRCPSKEGRALCEGGHIEELEVPLWAFRRKHVAGCIQLRKL